jgi:hypothetical protein
MSSFLLCKSMKCRFDIIDEMQQDNWSSKEVVCERHHHFFSPKSSSLLLPDSMKSPYALCSKSAVVRPMFFARRRKKTRLPNFHASMPAKNRKASMKTMPHSQVIPVCLKTSWLMT